MKWLKTTSIMRLTPYPYNMNIMKLLAFTFFLLTALQIQGQRPEYDKRTPFSMVTFIEDHPYAMVDNQWCKLLRIEDVSISEYISLSKKEFEKEWKKGIYRYLHYLMDDMGIVREDSVSVTYESNGVPITKSFILDINNRDLATQYVQQKIADDLPHLSPLEIIPETYQYLISRIDNASIKDSTWINKNEIAKDLSYLMDFIQKDYSYVDLRGYDYETALRSIITGIEDGLTRRDLAFQLKMFLAEFGDGHSRVSIRDVLTENEYNFLHFSIGKQDGKFIAYHKESKKLYDEDYSFITEIGGVKIRDLYNSAKNMVAKTTPSYVEKNARSYLAFTSLLLKSHKISISDSVVIKLTNGVQEKKVHIAWNSRPERSSRPSAYSDTILAGNLGYIAFKERMHRDDE